MQGHRREWKNQLLARIALSANGQKDSAVFSMANTSNHQTVLPPTYYTVSMGNYCVSG